MVKVLGSVSKASRTAEIRLLETGFEDKVELVQKRKRTSTRQTLLFSATLTSSLATLESMAMTNTLKYDLTKTHKAPPNLLQKYLFLPQQVKLSYLVCLLQHCIMNDSNQIEKKKEQKSLKKNKKDTKLSFSSFSEYKLSYSIIIFVNSCKRCQEISEALLELGIDCVCLHSMMTQRRRMTSLARFRNCNCQILLCTDIASRGLDIPSVNIVINYDLPKILTDYIHRIGRTARAGKAGESITLVTQFDVEMLQSVEDHTGVKMEVPICCRVFYTL